MVISLSLHLYFTFLRKTVEKKKWKFRRSNTLRNMIVTTCGGNWPFCYRSQNQNFFVSAFATKPYLYGILLKIIHVLSQEEACLKAPSKVEFYVNSFVYIYIYKTFRSTRKGKKWFLWWAYACLTSRCYTTSHLHQVFFDLAQIFSLFSLVFRTSNFWILRNLIKQLFHSHLLDMRLVIANSALRASLAIYHLISNARSWNNC